MKQVRNTAISIFALILAFMWLAPLMQPVGAAFSEPTFRMTFFLSGHSTFKNLSYVWNAILFARYYLNTLILVVVTFCIRFVISILAAYVLAVMDFKGRALVFAAIFMRIIIPNDMPITPNFMALTNTELTDIKVSIMLPFFGSVLAIFLLRQHFKSIPKALTEAARIDDTNAWQTIQRTYTPYTKPVYVSFVTISVNYHWNNHLQPLIVTNLPSNRALTVGLTILARSREANMQWTSVCAATFIAILPLLMALFFLQRQSMNSFVSVGIKE